MTYPRPSERARDMSGAPPHCPWMVRAVQRVAVSASLCISLSEVLDSHNVGCLPVASSDRYVWTRHRVIVVTSGRDAMHTPSCSPHSCLSVRARATSRL